MLDRLGKPEDEDSCNYREDGLHHSDAGIYALGVILDNICIKYDPAYKRRC